MAGVWPDAEMPDAEILAPADLSVSFETDICQ
jgi:hypothetical protein